MKGRRGAVHFRERALIKSLSSFSKSRWKEGLRTAAKKPSKQERVSHYRRKLRLRSLTGHRIKGREKVVGYLPQAKRKVEKVIVRAL